MKWRTRVRVRVKDGPKRQPAATDVTITVTDVAERPSAPATPAVTAASQTGLSVSWSAPANTGPAITDYDLQYRTGTDAWTAWPHDGTATSATITGLTGGVSYEVQVRASNDEGTGDWSSAGSGSTSIQTDTNRAPTFPPGRQQREVPENTDPGTSIGAPVTATDPEGDTLTYALGGGKDKDSFTIVASSGQLQVKDPLDYETKSTYKFKVSVTDNAEQRIPATTNVTITVTDVAERPSPPAAPAVTAASQTGLSVSWRAPDNTGPAITGYDLRYRTTGTAAWTAWSHDGTATSATITGLTGGVSYEVQVRASNDEGTGDWSSAGSGSTSTQTDTNLAPTFGPAARLRRGLRREVPENTAPGTSIGAPVTATDPEKDTLTYSLAGKDNGSFAIVASSGQLQVNAPLDYETKRTYRVTVSVTDNAEQRIPATIDVTITVTNEIEFTQPQPTLDMVSTPTRLRISWAEPMLDKKIDSYTVRYGEKGGPMKEWPHRISSTTTSITIPNLKPGRTYIVEVIARNGTETIRLGQISATTRSATSDPRRETLDQPRIAIWTDALAYLPGDRMQLYFDIEPRDSAQDYALFVYRLELATGARVWLDLRTQPASFHPEPIDIHGQSQQELWAQPLVRFEGQRLWEGPVAVPGHWQFVAELRTADGTYVLKRAYASFLVAGGGTHVVADSGGQQRLQADEHWAGDTIQLLRGRLVVPSGVTLQIEAGAHVLASRGAAIVVREGGRIVARGQREKPIVMTCASRIGERVPGCWGGLQIHGDDENKQELSYVRVEFAGGWPNGAGPAVSFDSVSKTADLNHVQAHEALGQGLQFKGGDVTCYRCVASNARQAGIQWLQDFEGVFQDLYVQQAETAASGIRGGGGQKRGRSVVSMYNATLVGPGHGSGAGSGIQIDGANVMLSAYNFIVTGFSGYGIEARNGAGRRVSDGSLRSFLFGVNGMGAVNLPLADKVALPTHLPRLLNVRLEPNPDPRPHSGAKALVPGEAVVPTLPPMSHARARHVGAFGADNWLEQWTCFGTEEQYRAAE